MSMRTSPPGSSSRDQARIPIRIRRSLDPRIPMPILRFAVACLLGVATALLASCGSSGKGLIPVANAGPLRSDFEAVATDARSGGGNCSATEAAILQTEHDFSALPAIINSGLRERLQSGIKNLRERALELCAQPQQQTTATSSTPRATTSTPTTATTPTVTQSTSSQTTPATTTPTTSSTGGGTQAPSESEGASGLGNGRGGAGSSGGAGQGAKEGTAGSGGKEAGGGGAGGQEGRK